MKKIITLLPGDGIGPEIIEEATKVLAAIASKFGHTFKFQYGLIGAAAIDKCGHPYPTATHELCLNCHAILFGAIGHPKYDNNPSAKIRPEQGLLKMRKELGLYANIRPVQLFSSLKHRSPLREEIIKGVDLVIVRELTGGIYFGEPRGLNQEGTIAFDTCVYSIAEVERIAKTAFQIALTRAAAKRENQQATDSLEATDSIKPSEPFKPKVTLVDKANVLATSQLWRETVKKLHESQFPEVELEFMFVDNAAMQLVTAPSKFDVILTENMFGDILSDQASVLTGSIGLLPSASFGSNVPLFEPIHGSYPQAAGKNIANPLATILSAALMLRNAFGLQEEAKTLEAACKAAIDNNILTEDLWEPHLTNNKGQSKEKTQIIEKQAHTKNNQERTKAYSTSEVGNFIVQFIENSSS
ncbi:MAG: 3-isopropylmalate dehydrogenase [Bacteroidales bacterium]|nr:3-isopropylmalate dehydrogenase [Bacteroidales bacterium]